MLEAFERIRDAVAGDAEAAAAVVVAVAAALCAIVGLRGFGGVGKSHLAIFLAKYMP